MRSAALKSGMPKRKSAPRMPTRVTLKVVALGHHLGPHQNLDGARLKVPPQSVVGSAGPHGLTVHSGDPSLRESFQKRRLDLLGTLPEELQTFASTGGTGVGHGAGVTAVVTLQAVGAAVEGQRHRTFGALDGFPAVAAKDKGGKAQAISKEHGLPPLRQRALQSLTQFPWRGWSWLPLA